jgi:REP element-mobilizing transposase RayT
MKYNPLIHNRRSIRLKGYDYSKAGLYFITFCVQNKESLFGKIENNEMILNDAGKMIHAEWEKLPHRFQNIDLHEFVVMPNHFHGILEILTFVGAPLVGAQTTGAPEEWNNNDTKSPMPTVWAPLVDAQTTGAPEGWNNNDAKSPMPTVAAALVDTQTTGAPDGENNDMMDTEYAASYRNGAPTKGRAPTRGAPTEVSANHTLGEMMGAYKSITTVEYINGVNTLGWEPFAGKLWQRNYYEHIIRNEPAYYKISDYIINNPAHWQDDKFYRK